MWVTRVYYNANITLLSAVFAADFVSGELKIQPEEISEAKFVKLIEGNMDQYITHPHMKSRSFDALQRKGFVPYEHWTTEPFRRITRIDPTGVQEI